MTCQKTWHLLSRCPPSASVSRLISSQNHFLNISWTNSFSSEPISSLHYFFHLRNPGLIDWLLNVEWHTCLPGRITLACHSMLSSCLGLASLAGALNLSCPLSQQHFTCLPVEFTSSRRLVISSQAPSTRNNTGIIARLTGPSVSGYLAFRRWVNRLTVNNFKFDTPSHQTSMMQLFADQICLDMWWK